MLVSRIRTIISRKRVRIMSRTANIRAQLLRMKDSPAYFIRI